MRCHDKHKWLTFTLCAYECAAIATGKVPTISRISKNRKWVGVTITGSLAVHFWNYDRRS
jgi:hypothetical protein